MNKILGVLLALTAFTLSAEVFKCKSSNGVPEYQQTPCASPSEKQAVIDIKPMTSQQEEQARIRLQAWRDEQEASEQAKVNAEKQRQAELDKQAELNALQRSATASEQQALAAQRLAEQAGNQNRTNGYNTLIPGYRYGQPNYGAGMGYRNGFDNDADDHRRRHGHEGRHERRHDDGLQHQQQLGDYGIYRPPGSVGNGLGNYGPAK
ncbi:DUF4124 domain-containing protein [Crenothrix sp.]|uniref:DUF4124 domain-containing protein n=1 Tax=Crenothrix sp. TaxID=3100433 RepID=UPI00374CE518